MSSSTAACIVELAADGLHGASLLEAEKLMKEVPKLTKKLAGKSLPIEVSFTQLLARRKLTRQKLVVRKTRKFEHQGQRLFLPGVELAYVFGSLSHAPRRALISVLIPRINKRLAELAAVSPEDYGRGYWDGQLLLATSMRTRADLLLDYCLGHFLRGVCKAIARYQPPHADGMARAVKPGDPSDAELGEGAEQDLLAVIRHTPDIEVGPGRPIQAFVLKIQLDHYISYHCHFELGKLYGLKGDAKAANKHFDIVMSGEAPSDHASTRYRANMFFR
jgi:hypothetical protein